MIKGIISEERRYASIPYQESGNNHQIFSDIVNSYGLTGCQDQAWCATYQFALELQMCGKDIALKHWCMTDRYVGYSVFETRDAFKRMGRTGSTPRVGALVIFKRSHMGRVLSVNTNTFECGEGNTSNHYFNRDGDCCAVKTYSNRDSGIDCFCYIDYDQDMNTTQLIASSRAVYEMAHYGHYRYGDSRALPPCSDGIISCDRLIARALWNLGYTSQPQGGITVMNMEQYLLSWGFQKIGPGKALKPGDIVLMKVVGQLRPTAAWHVYIVVAVSVEGGVTYVDKYDMGSQDRINSAQPFRHCLVNEWATREFYCAFRYGAKDYTFTPQDVKIGATGPSQYLASEILKAYGIKATRGKEIEPNGKWTTGDMAAMCQWKLDRIRNDKVNLCKGPYGAGEIGPRDWESLLSSGLPFKAVEIPAKEKKGPSVLLAQRILKANGYKVALDAEYGPETEAAIKAWQKAAGRPVTGSMTYDDWKLILKDI